MIEKYLIIQDFEHFGELLLKKDNLIDVVDGKLTVESSMGQITLNLSKVESYVKKYEPIEIDVQEVLDEELEVIKNYKLVLEFKTTKAKSRELENFLRREIPKYI